MATHIKYPMPLQNPRTIANKVTTPSFADHSMASMGTSEYAYEWVLIPKGVLAYGKKGRNVGYCGILRETIGK